MNGSRWMRSKMYIVVWAVLALSLLLLIQGNGKKAVSGVIVAGIVFAVVKYFGAKQAEQSSDPQQHSYGILVICEQADDEDEIQHEELLDEMFAAGNVDISYQCTANELKEWNPSLDVLQLPCFMVLNGNSSDELEVLVKHPFFYSSDHREVIRFIQENKK
ncbi:hypothetical protein LQV63_04985 [Paenibacillus profundus]|uniref:Uncharacterized protein n=1 Tax=Paenibacillus profundus TaxID=1173085 RepID=A0ABS8YE10_9BACL|nr:MULTISPECIES: hypothetical protein [Paenibacillus]MCE5168668.1 hypothetical protein [Paenibacillus profundus]